MSLLGFLVSRLGSGPDGGGDNLAMVNALVRMLANDAPGGGLAGLVGKLQQSGLGNVVDSWIGREKNLPISAEQVEEVLGADTIARIARPLGMDNGEVAGQLAHVMPHVVDALTPDGHLSPEGPGHVDELLARIAPV